MAGAPPNNVRRWLFMRTDRSGRTLTLSEFKAAYGFEPDGVNAYVGIHRATVRRCRDTGHVLDRDHRWLFDDCRDSLLRLPNVVATGRSPAGSPNVVATGRSPAPAQEKWIDLGLWPFQPGDPYGPILSNLSVVERLAEELHDYQEQVRRAGKRLEIVVRYASEMNDPATPRQPWGRRAVNDVVQRALFRTSFRAVREVFRERAPRVRFAFSPALRADQTGPRYDIIHSYWPGDDCVDFLGCTWYVGSEGDLEGAVRVLKRYLRDHRSRRLPLVIEEMGGALGDRGNDAMLGRMFAALSGLAAEGYAFDYGSLFLESRWGADATLAVFRRRL